MHSQRYKETSKCTTTLNRHILPFPFGGHKIPSFPLKLNSSFFGGGFCHEVPLPPRLPARVVFVSNRSNGNPQQNWPRRDQRACLERGRAIRRQTAAFRGCGF